MHAGQRHSGEVLRAVDLWPYKHKEGKRRLSRHTAPEKLSAHLLARQNGGGRYLNRCWYPNLCSSLGQCHTFHPGPGVCLTSRARPSINKDIRLGPRLRAVALCKVIPASDRHTEQICTDFASLQSHSCSGPMLCFYKIG